MFSESDLTELEIWPYDVLGDAAVFMRQSYKYNSRDNRQFSEMSPGLPASRLMSTYVIADHSGLLALNDGELVYFEWWYTNKINHGNNWFKINLMTAAGMNSVPAKFAKNGKGIASLDRMRYSLPCKLIAVELPSITLTEAEVKTLVQTGAFKLQVAANGLEEIVHGDW